MKTTWDERYRTAMGIINSHKERSIKLIAMLTESYEEATSISDYKRIGLSIRKETLKLERITSSDYYYKLMTKLETQEGK